MVNDKKIVIIDYKLNNLFSVQHACNSIGLNTKISSDKNEVFHADALILPGTGAFGDAMKNLRELDLIDSIKYFVKKKKPLMGICLGMQLLFSRSMEFGNHEGLNLIEGKVEKFCFEKKAVNVPQIGWNQIFKSKFINWENTPFNGLKDGEFMYFIHSYFATPKNKQYILSTTSYEGKEYCSSIIKENLFATQFHPEKSSKEGLKIYKNWLNKIL